MPIENKKDLSPQDVLTMEEYSKTQPQPPQRKRTLSPIDTSSSALPDPSTSFPNKRSGSGHTPSPTKKPLVFKQPTKHEFTWSELSRLVASKDLKPMGRSEAVQTAYQRAIKRRTKKYGSPDEYIRQRILHWPPAEKNDSEEYPPSDGNESSGSCSSISPPSSPTGPVDPLEVTLKKNEFPYSVKKGIEHWLIWSRHPLTDEVWIRRYLEERLPGRDYLFFINPPELRSVPSIFHVQVFTKGEGEVLDEEDMENKKEEQEAATAAKAEGETIRH
ncbi:hypothetical protein EMPS_11376 [Entomortierella parvispora]|uniref:Uncharacterized protein n=1 Tax=Entomortierella parvispora TaxID=205924 RepID=A0A9P3HLR0_9FUNG|nr:hypothetical protein EMPS_11376 [Entomortierella parvispora]